MSRARIGLIHDKQNAASLDGLLMTTEAMVAEEPEKKGPKAPTMSPEDMY